MCSQKTSFLSTTAARRLKLKSALGSRHQLCWHSSSDDMDKKTRRTSFTVVEDNAIPTNVAVGTGWLTEEMEADMDDAESSHSTQEQPRSPGMSTRTRPTLVVVTDRQQLTVVKFSLG